MSMKPLEQVEIANNLRHIFEYDSQYLKKMPNRKSAVCVVNRRCVSCNQISEVKVATVRQSINQNCFTGMCLLCAAKNIPRKYRKGESSSQWKGGRRTTPKGYVMVRQPNHPKAQNGYIQEHRLIMEKHLGRYLLPKETVHHKNGKKDDNRIENLELWGCSHGTGSRYADWSNEQITQLIHTLQDILENRIHCV